MGDRKALRWILVVLFWGIVAFGAAAGYKYFVKPHQQEKLEVETGSMSQYKEHVTVAVDAFSGYAALRSPACAKLLKEDGIKIELSDDKADYVARLKALDAGDVQLAVFTIDSFLTARAKAGKDPATIIAVIDQSVGADAIVAFKDAVGKIQDLDRADARFVLTPDSPSEFLARTVLSSFSLPSLPDQWFESAKGAGDVLAAMKTGDHSAKRAYVLWEPYVSQALEIPGTHVLLDSSKCRDCIVDVLVVQRQFLREHPDLVQKVVEAYFRAEYSYSQQTDGVARLVMEDAKTGTEPLTDVQSKTLAAKIQWKRVLENYAHFGIVADAGLQHLEDIIPRIADILVKTGALPQKPTDAEVTSLFYDGILKTMHVQNFHPGKKIAVLDGVGLGNADLDAVRAATELPALDDAEWAKLIPVGNARVEPIGFSRGTADISEFSQGDLAQLAKNCASWAQYYLRIVGRSRTEGDAAANAALAQQRAHAVAEYLKSNGVHVNRVRVEVAKPNGDGGAAEVSFTLLQKPY